MENQKHHSSLVFEREIKDTKAFLNHNAMVLMANASCHPNSTGNCQIVYLDGPPAYEKTGPVFGSVWNGLLQGEARRPMAQSSAIDLLNAVVFDKVKCSGSLCGYDPPNLPPGKLTCQDDPCPKGQDCCAYYQSFTCCAVGQHCVSGFCQ